MKKIKKGAYGYRNNHRKHMLLIVLLFLLAIATQAGARAFVTNQATKNILTVMAILTVLPMANLASPLIAAWKFKTGSQELFEICQGNQDKYLILYDLIISSKEQLMPLDVVIIHPTGVYAYCSSTQISETKIQDYIYSILSQHRLTDHVSVVNTKADFIKLMNRLKPTLDYPEDEAAMNEIAVTLKSISM